jgi:hypothetical protein
MISVSHAALIIAALSLTGIVIAASVALHSFDAAGKAVRPYRATLQTIRVIGFITVLFMGLMVIPLG